MLTVPTMRKIRAYYRGERCNAVFLLQKGRLRLSACNDLGAMPSHHMVDLGVFRVFRVSIIATYEYFAHYTHNFFLCGERVEGSAWILHIENETAIGAGQAV
jgi:hypothetical protein